MKYYKKQNGASMPMTLLFICMAMIILTIAFKLYPAYYENWQIKHVLDGFHTESGLEDMGARQIKDLFYKRLLTNSVREFDSEEGLTVKKTDGLLTIEIDYEVRTTIYNNVDAVVSFQSSLERQL